MNKHTYRAFRRTAVATALFAAFGGAAVADDEITAYTAPDSQISVGIGNWSAERQQQGIYDGMRNNGAYGLVDVEVSKRNDADGTWLNVVGRNLGVDPRDLTVDYLRQGDFGIGFDYSRITRDNPLEINSGIQGKDSERQNLVTVAPGRGADIRLGTKRDTIGLRFYKNLMPGLEFNASYKNEEKDGTRHWGRGGAAEFAVEPIDSTTRQFEARLDFSRDKLQLTAGYLGSWYRNHNSIVHTTAAGANPFFLTLPLDNQAHQVFAEGGYSFTPTTRGTFKLSYGRATQDESLPTRSMTGIAGFAGNFAGAPYSLDGRLDTTLVQLGVTSRPFKDLSLVANVRYHDLDDKTPQRRIIQTNAACGIGQCYDNTPFSYRTLTGKLEATYRLPLGYSLTAGVDRKDQKRDNPVGNRTAAGLDLQRVVPMRSEVDELTYRLEARKSMSETINGSLSYSRADREGNAYSTTKNADTSFINPMHIADRTRDKWRVALDWTPLENFSTQFVYENARDDYDSKPNRPFGMVEGSADIYTVDASYTLGNGWAFNAWYSYDDTDAKQRNGRTLAGAASNRWTSELHEKGNNLGIGMRGKLFSKLSLDGDLQWSKTRSKYPQTTDAGVLNNLPEIENKLTRLSLLAKYALEKHSDIQLHYIHERWKTDDWTWQFSNGSPFTYGTATDGTTVTMDRRQISNFLGIRYIYKFQ